MKERDQVLIVVAKLPAPGWTKTRLSPGLTGMQSAELYASFLSDTLDSMRHVSGVALALAYTPDGAARYFANLAPDFLCFPQCGPQLGVRLDNAITHCLNLGYTRVAIMNSYSPTLPCAYLNRAFQLLVAEDDVVLGPCHDGGFYLIGCRQPIPKLLRGVPMSTSTVARDVEAIARQEGLFLHRLPTWYEVDDPQSLEHLEQELVAAPPNVAARTRQILAQIGKRAIPQ